MSSRLTPLAVLVLSLPALVACGGDDPTPEPADDSSPSATSSQPATPDQPDTSEEPDPAQESPSPSPSATSSDGPGSGAEDEPPIPLIPGEPCDAQVALTGAVEDDWDAEGTVLVVEGDAGPPVTYQSASGQNVVTVYGAGNGFDLSVVLTAGPDSYGSAAGAAGLEVADDGSGATVETDLAGPGGEEQVRVSATFTC